MMISLLGKRINASSSIGCNKVGLVLIPLSRFSTQSAATKEHWRVRDQLIRAHTHNLQIALINNTRATKVAKEKHTLDNTGTKLLGECMSGVSLMASLLEGEERVTVEANNIDGYERVYAEAIQLGEVRGLVAKSATPLPLTKSILSIRKILYQQAKPVTGIIDLKDADITSLFRQYFHISEQIPTAFKVETVMQENEHVKFSGGVLIQTLPNAPSGLIEEVQKRVSSHTLAELFVDSKMSLSEIIPLLIPKEELTLTHKNTQNKENKNNNENNNSNSDNNGVQLATTRTLIDFHCRCSKNAFRDKLLTIGAAELETLKNDKQRDMHCYFCSKKYELTDQDFEWLFEKIREKEKQS
eukprot:TRINITY_DN4994_c0_g1_i3.p1 TRINITY_DN4994_c0_g1~~TRINITY_DN4994_c0_g1_i3.p1  ORF type:complete len:356 (+),score=81.18 TRINITY_DN4994_c0_g1_i3:1110-2177(+)